VHHHYFVGYGTHGCNVVGDEEIGNIGFLLKAHEQREDFLLHDLVKGGGYLIADDDFRFCRQSAGNGNALLLAA
jgi:hypothetical protein